MNSVLDGASVGLVLAASVAYAVYSLGPRSWRPRLLSGVAAVLRRLPKVFGLGAAAQRLEAAGVSKSTGACGGCENCGSAPAAPGPKSSEVRIPLAKIGKRSNG